LSDGDYIVPGVPEIKHPGVATGIERKYKMGLTGK